MANEALYTTGGALTGLVSALALRKLLDSSTPIDWKDALTWGGIGAALGGAAGYGLSMPTPDKDKLSDPQIEELKKQNAKLEAALPQLRKEDAEEIEKIGWLQLLDRHLGKLGAGAVILHKLRKGTLGANFLPHTAAKITQPLTRGKAGKYLVGRIWRGGARGGIIGGLGLLVDAARNSDLGRRVAGSFAVGGVIPAPNTRARKAEAQIKLNTDMINSGKVKAR